MVDGTFVFACKDGSKKMKETITKIAGIDTGKQWLHVAAGEEAVRVFANTAQGCRELADHLTAHAVVRAGIEATGGYERDAVRTLRSCGVEVVVLQPGQVRGFAQYLGLKAKTDPVDARLIARCTAGIKTRQGPPDERLEALAEHLTLIEQIEADLVRWKTRLEGHRLARQKDQARAEIARLKAWRAAELKALAQAIAVHDDLNTRLGLIESVPGLGRRTALALLIRMPELGELSREEAAALAGLAPYPKDSGSWQGQRRIEGGRARLRRSLYAAALPAAYRWNPGVVALYQRLTRAGKPHKVALVACARKLLIYANAVVHRQQKWSPQNAPS